MAEEVISTRKGGGRLLKAVVEARESEAIIMFRSGSSAKTVQEYLKTKYGKQMRAKRLYELKKLAQAKDAEAAVTLPVTAELVV